MKCTGHAYIVHFTEHKHVSILFIINKQTDTLILIHTYYIHIYIHDTCSVKYILYIHTYIHTYIRIIYVRFRSFHWSVKCDTFHGTFTFHAPIYRYIVYSI